MQSWKKSLLWFQVNYQAHIGSDKWSTFIVETDPNRQYVNTVNGPAKAAEEIYLYMLKLLTHFIVWLCGEHMEYWTRHLFSI